MRGGNGNKFVFLNWPSGWCVLSLEVRPACTTPEIVNCTNSRETVLLKRSSLTLSLSSQTGTKKNCLIDMINQHKAEKTAAVCRVRSLRPGVRESRSSLGCSVLCESRMKDVINAGSLTEGLISGGELKNTVNTQTLQKSLEQNSVSKA